MTITAIGLIKLQDLLQYICNFNYCIFSAYFFDILHMADFDIQRQAGGNFSSCQDVEVPMLRDEGPAPFASAPTAIQKGVTLQRYVETCRECLDSTT